MPARKAKPPVEQLPTRREALTAYAEDRQCELTFFEPASHFDHAIVGLVYGHGQEPVVLYDERLVLDALVTDGMTREEANEWFEVNTLGTYVGPSTPRFLVLRTEGLPHVRGH